MMATTSIPPVTTVQARLNSELALPSRIGHTALLLAALAMVTVIGALLLTEPDLPARTRIAFVAMLAIGVSWVVFATWVLRRRHVLYARHRVVAGWMSVTFSTAFTAGCVLLGVLGEAGRWWVPAALTGGVLVTVAGVLLIRAMRAVIALERRRGELAQVLATGQGRAE